MPSPQSSGSPTLQMSVQSGPHSWVHCPEQTVVQPPVQLVLHGPGPSQDCSQSPVQDMVQSAPEQCCLQLDVHSTEQTCALQLCSQSPVQPTKQSPPAQLSGQRDSRVPPVHWMSQVGASQVLAPEQLHSRGAGPDVVPEPIAVDPASPPVPLEPEPAPT